MNDDRWFLWGLPASGKTTLGRQWAQRLGRPFADLDERIERRHGPIPELFARFGHWGFRLRERAELRLLVNDFRRGIVAVGGGTPCHFDNADFMNAVGATIWLDVEPETAAMRIANGQRPLFDGANPLDKMRQLWQQRLFYYQKAQKIFRP